MNPNDAPFDDDAPQSGGIFNLSRDTLVLFASLGFLALAILLAVFSGGDREPIPVAQVTLVATRPVITAIAEPTVAPDAPAIAYPAPGFGDGLVSAAEPYPAPVDAETPTSAVPTFAPLRPTEPAPIIMTATPPDFAASQATAYPAPEQPTIAPPPTSMPVADTATPAAIAQAQTQPRPTRAPPAPTEVPLLRLRGTTYWRAAQSPILVSTDVHIMPGAALVIEPGVEVQIAPGVALFVEGKLYALGQPGRRVRFTSSTSQRWEGIYGRGGSEIVLEQVEMRGGGAGGTLLASEGGSLVIKGSRFANNGGHIRSDSSRVEVRESEITANDMPYGAALDLSFEMGGFAIVSGNRIGGNRMATGAPPLLLANQSPFDILNIDVQGNLLIGQDGPNLTVQAIGQVHGQIRCNALLNGANGLSVKSALPQVPGLRDLVIRDNAIEDHLPPIIPVYLEYGIGRGATSDVLIDMRNNWWDSSLGPYEPDRHADGRGDAPGDMVEFRPWLTSRPSCAPRP